MKENEIVEHKSGFYIVPNECAIKKCRDVIADALESADISAADALSGLCFSMVELAYECDIKKPHLLNSVNSMWEQIENHYNEEES